MYIPSQIFLPGCLNLNFTFNQNRRTFLLDQNKLIQVIVILNHESDCSLMINYNLQYPSQEQGHRLFWEVDSVKYLNHQ